MTLTDVREKYLPRIVSEDTANPFVAVLDSIPFGYIQFYDAFAADHAWWPDPVTPGVIGIDQFVADGKSLSRVLERR